MSLPHPLNRFLDAALTAARQSGTRVVGYLGNDIPVEIILAAQAQPLRLCEQPGLDTALAERFVEGTFSLAARQVAQRWLAGELDHLDAVVFSRGDDNAQRLYYYLCELQRTGEYSGPRPLLFDIARVDRPTSLAHTIASARRLAEELQVDTSQLPAAIGRVRSRVQLLQRLDELQQSGTLPGTLAYAALRAAQHHWDSDFDTALDRWLAQPHTATPARRLALIGSEPQHELLHAAAEAGGATICCQIHERARGPLMASAGTTDLLAEIATHYHHQACALRRMLSTPDEIVAHIRTAGADGAILWLTATDSALAWETPRIANALRAAGIPTLALTLQEAFSDDASLARVAEFAETLEAP